MVGSLVEGRGSMEVERSMEEEEEERREETIEWSGQCCYLYIT